MPDRMNELTEIETDYSKVIDTRKNLCKELEDLLAKGINNEITSDEYDDKFEELWDRRFYIEGQLHAYEHILMIIGGTIRTDYLEG